jgi:hypothetical protein
MQSSLDNVPGVVWVWDGVRWARAAGVNVAPPVYRRTTDYTLDVDGSLSPVLMNANVPDVGSLSAAFKVTAYLPGASSTVTGDRAVLRVYDTDGTQCGAGYLNVTAGVGDATSVVCDIGGATSYAAEAGSQVTVRAQRAGGTGAVTLRFLEGGSLRIEPYLV